MRISELSGFLTEARMTKTKQRVLDLFIGTNGVTQFSEYLGTGRVRGGGSASGKAMMKAIRELERDGIIEVIDYERSGTSKKITIKLNNMSLIRTEPNEDEKEVYRAIQRYNESDFKRDFLDYYNPNAAERRAMETLRKMGYISKSNLEPTILKDL